MHLRNLFCTCALTVTSFAISACSTDPATVLTGSTTSPLAPTTPSRVITRQGFIWSAEKGLQVIPVPDAASSMNVTALNNDGQVVGYVTLGEGSEAYRAFIWSASNGYKALGSLVGPEGVSMAFSITDGGDVTGVSEGPHSNLYSSPMGIVLPDAFVWNEKTGIEPAPPGSTVSAPAPVNAGGKLRLPPGSDCVSDVRVNDSGQAVGYSGSTGKDGCRPTNALLWEPDGAFVIIDQCGPRPWCRTTVAAVNNRGEVVGYTDGTSFRWTASGGMVRIPMPDASISAINDKGDAAGSARIDGILTPIVWTASGQIKVIPMPAGATYGFSVRINNNGVVLGSVE